mgnify:CR=1 FL=1
MDTLQAIATRKSTRNFTSQQLPEESLQTILQAGFAAPVAMGNYESLHITVVQDPAALGKVNACTEEMFFRLTGNRRELGYGAQTLVLVSTQPVHRPGTNHANAGIVVENMVLAATAIGIDSVILGAAPAAVAKDEGLLQALGIPAGFEPVLGAFFGYGAEPTPVKSHTISVNWV